MRTLIGEAHANSVQCMTDKRTHQSVEKFTAHVNKAEESLRYYIALKEQQEEVENNCSSVTKFTNQRRAAMLSREKDRDRQKAKEGRNEQRQKRRQ